MDAFAIWLAIGLFFSWLAPKPATAPTPPPPPPAPVSSSTIILLPEPDGSRSGIIIKTGGQEISVTEPYQGVSLTGGKVEQKTFTAAEVDKLFPEVLKSLPEKQLSFTLHFESSGTRLTPESTAELKQIRQEISRRPAPEVVVTGYTDRVGAEDANLRLSLDRAKLIRDILISDGVPANLIQIVGRGELDPEVPTADNVPEPRNRRVEISVR